MKTISLVLIVLVASIVTTATITPTLAKKSDQYMAGYREGAAKGAQAAEDFDSGKTKSLDATKPSPCDPAFGTDYCKGLAKGHEDKIVDEEG